MTNFCYKRRPKFENDHSAFNVVEWNTTRGTNPIFLKLIEAKFTFIRMASWEVANNRKRGGNKNNLSNNINRNSASSEDEAKVSQNSVSGITKIQSNMVNKPKTLSDRKPNPDHQYKEIYIPTKSVGKVIGKGGSKIKELHTSCECKFVISSQTRGEDTMIKLIGNSGQISKAEQSIMQIITEKVSVRPKFISDEKGHEQTDGEQMRRKQRVPEQRLKEKEKPGFGTQQWPRDERVLPSRDRFQDFGRLY